ncbi:MAG: hypothetical protein BWY14_00841 [Parcubacteria group bacterium ADurb.Bin192]|nr:MAG: hypothetical protein BWY14_00841 [Parcubacteria group bacterium ADurb.Bin192]
MVLLVISMAALIMAEPFFSLELILVSDTAPDTSMAPEISATAGLLDTQVDHCQLYSATGETFSIVPLFKAKAVALKSCSSLAFEKYVG